jgi:hypothetical protein
MEFTLTISSSDRTSKRVQILKALQKGLTESEIFEVEQKFYFEEAILCVDAYHFEINNLGVKEYTGIYTWYIPSQDIDSMMFLMKGDIIEVENLDDTALVEVSYTYYKSKEMHEEEIHPYCAVLRLVERYEEPQA